MKDIILFVWNSNPILVISILILIWLATNYPNITLYKRLKNNTEDNIDKAEEVVKQLNELNDGKTYERFVNKNLTVSIVTTRRDAFIATGIADIVGKRAILGSKCSPAVEKIISKKFVVTK